MNDGWIKMYRKFLDWKWYDDINTKCLFLHLLLKANVEEMEWHRMTLKVGQYVTTVARLSEEIGLSPKKIRLSLSKLVETGEIDIQTTNKYSMISICNFERYQENETHRGQTKDKQKTNKGQTKDKQRATEQEYKNNKDNNSLRSLSSSTLEERESKFYEDLVPFVEIYGKEMIRAFFNYWSEQNKSKTKMRFELEKTWDLKKRLTTWSNRQKENHNGSYSNNQQKVSQRLEREKGVTDLIARLRAQDATDQE